MLRACGHVRKHTSHAKPIYTRVNKQNCTQILQTQMQLSWMMWLDPKIRANIAAPDWSATNGVLEMVRKRRTWNGFLFFHLLPENSSLPTTFCRWSVSSNQDFSDVGLNKKMRWLAPCNEHFGAAFFSAPFPRILNNEDYFEHREEDTDGQLRVNTAGSLRKTFWILQMFHYHEPIATYLLNHFNSTSVFDSKKIWGGISHSFTHFA